MLENQERSSGNFPLLKISFEQKNAQNHFPRRKIYQQDARKNFLWIKKPKYQKAFPIAERIFRKGIKSYGMGNITNYNIQQI